MEQYSALIPNRPAASAVRQVYLVRDQEEWQLPAFIPHAEIYNTDPQSANRVIQEQLGVSVTTRCALRIHAKQTPVPLNIYVTDPASSLHTAVPQLPGSWFSRQDLYTLAFAFPEQKAVVKAWFAEAAEESLPELYLPWWKEGWFEKAAAWLETQVRQLGRPPIAPVEQLRCAYTASILRVPTHDGYVYLKAVPSLFAQEITITQALAERFPAQAPPLLRAEGTWMLLEEMHGQPLSPEVPLPRWEEVVRFYAQLQVQSVSQRDFWQSLGGFEIQTERLSIQLEEILAQAAARLRGLPQRLSESEEQQLKARLPRLQEQCARLVDYGVPDALEHGDLHAGNILMADDSFRIFDWSHTCLTCPFYGFGSLLLDDDWFPGQPQPTTRLRDAYLEPWTAFLPMEPLIAAFELWKQIRPLFQIAHQSHIVGTYQTMLGGQDYLPETATGNSLQHMQWWLAAGLRTLLSAP